MLLLLMMMMMMLLLHVKRASFLVDHRRPAIFRELKRDATERARGPGFGHQIDEMK